MSLSPACSATSTSRLNDSVFELYNPGVESVLDVVFFHDLQLSHTSEPHLSTWISSGSRKEVWPQTWLPEEFPRARILSVKYDASIRTSAKHGRLDLYLTAESLMKDLIFAKVGQHAWRPVILVGHSYGGLVIKQLCSESVPPSDKQMAGFLNSVTGAFFYGTPHHGISSFFTPDGTKLKDASPLLHYAKVLCAESARLHQKFDVLSQHYKWSIAGVGESNPTTVMLDAESQNAVAVSREMMIVDEASARYGDFTVELEDHISLCQPESRTSNTYIRLTSFLQSTYNNEVDRRRLPLKNVPKMAMSLHSHLFVELQKNLRTAPVVALYGMGGIGKTTLAKLLFNELCAKFEYTCFLTKTMLKGDTEEEIDRIVSSSLYHYGKQVLQRGATWKLSTLIQKKLLFVLDDFDNDMHVKLLQDVVRENKCANSRYIVTSRDRDILNQLEFAECECYVFDVKLLNPESSTELFMSHAFPYPTKPSPSLTEWIDKIVAKCDGLPLTLEMMGKYLKGKDNKSESYWKECFHALDEADNALRLDDRLWKKLRVSYDRLGSEEQGMFLDAASFFSNSRWTLQEAKASWRVLYGSPDRRWENLVNLSLVYEVKEQDSIQMHEQLKSLGIRLASGWGTGGRCRTWTHKNVPSKFNPSNYDERIKDTLLYSSDPSPHCNATHIEEVIALRLEDSMPLDSRNIGQMKKLRYLDSEKELMLDEIGGKLPKDIALLRFHGEVNNLHDMVDNWPAGRLAVLDLNAPLTCWPTTVSKFQNLEVLKFAACFFEGLPETFAHLPMLRYLTFTSCPRLRSLPEAFGQLSQLGSLEINECCNLEALPNSFGQLPCLQTFNIAMTSNLQRLPDGFGNLSKLQSLVIDGGREISELPESFGRLVRLQDLELRGMTSLKALPEGFGNLSELQILDIHEVREISELPKSFSRLSRLRDLWLSEVTSLKALPEEFGNLSELRSLAIEGGRDISELPESFGRLSRLRDLLLSGMTSLKALPDWFGNLSELQRLAIDGGRDISELPESFGRLSQLRELMLCEVTSLKALPKEFGNLSELQSLVINGGRDISELPESFGHLSQLRELMLCEVTSLKALPKEFGNLSELQSLVIVGGRYISELPESFGRLSRLRDLELQGMTSLKALPEGFGNLSELQRLAINGGRDISELPESFGRLSQLRELMLYEVTSLKALPKEFGNLSELQSLVIDGGRDISELPESFGRLARLRDLQLCGMTSLKALPEGFGNLSELQSLVIDGGREISELPESFGRLVRLQDLELRGMTSLKALPEGFGNLSELQILEIDEVREISELPKSFSRLSRLRDLWLCEVTSLKALPEEFGNLSELQSLVIDGGRNISDLPESFGRLSRLQDLKLRGMTSLKALPDGFGNLSELQRLVIDGGRDISELPESFGRLSRLRDLMLCGMTSLKALPEEFGNLSELQSLEIDEGREISELPESFGRLARLRDLELRGMTSLKALPEVFGNLSELQSLVIDRGRDISELHESFGRLSRLQDLKLIDVTSLSAWWKGFLVPDGFGNLSELQSLIKVGGEEISELPEASWFD